MPLLLFSLIFLLVVLFIAEPLLKGRRKVAPSEETSHLLADKERVYSILKELDADLQTGKISQEDFNRLRTQYMNQAIQLLKKIDDLPKRERSLPLSLEEKMDQLVRDVQKRGKGRNRQ